MSTTCYVPVEILDSVSQNDLHSDILVSRSRLKAPDGWVTTVQALMLSWVFLVSSFSLAHRSYKSCRAQRDSCLGCLRPFWVPQNMWFLSSHPVTLQSCFILFLSLFYASSRLIVSTAQHLMIVFLHLLTLPTFFSYILVYILSLLSLLHITEKLRPFIDSKK